MTDDIDKVLEGQPPDEEAPVTTAAPDDEDDEEDTVPSANVPGTVTLRMPRGRPYEEGYEFPEGNLDFGSGSARSEHHARTNIKFHADGQGDGYAVGVPLDHPALGDLLKRYPQVEVVDTTPKKVVYACDNCDKQVGSLKALKAHKRSHERKPTKSKK